MSVYADNGDGHRDIIIPEFYDILRFYRGNGDLTFKPAISIQNTNPWAKAGVMFRRRRKTLSRRT